MSDYLSTWLQRTLRTAIPASVATTAAASACGAADGNAVAPINAVGHVAWGDEAATQDDLSLEYTGVGAAINTAAIASWAAVYELAFGRRARQGDVTTALLGGAAIAAVAYVTDYYVVPKRLTPGFEKRLSGPAMFAVYATLALSLPITALCERETR